MVQPTLSDGADTLTLDIPADIVENEEIRIVSHNIPGRAGDSPVIGAGNYCDIRIGAATCVGTGEHAIRLGLARQTVNYLQNTGSVDEAVKNGIRDLYELDENGIIQILAMDKDGKVSACSNTKLHYVFASNEQPYLQKIDTIHLENN